MPLMIPREGGLVLLADLLSSGEDWLLGLFTSAIVPAETDVAATYTAEEAEGDWYERKTLTRSIDDGTWAEPTLAAPSGSPAWSTRSQVARSAYGSAGQSWTIAGEAVTVHGVFILGATSGDLILAEAFAAPRTLQVGDSLAFTPRIEIA